MFLETRFYLEASFILFEKIYTSYYEYKSCLTVPRFKASFILFSNGTVYSRSTRRGAHRNETNSLTHDYDWSYKVSSF